MGELKNFFPGNVGKDVHVVLPFCAVAKIRSAFPSAGGEYTGVNHQLVVNTLDSTIS